MKHNNFLLIILLTINFCANAQTTETIKVNAGDDIGKAVSSYGIYRFPSFTNGTIVLKDGKQGTEMLNYNILYGRIMYIDKTKGDTLAIGIPDQVRQITINDVLFYYDDKDCEEEIAVAETAGLLLKRQVSVDYLPRGAFGVTNPSSGGIDTYTSLPGSNLYNLIIDEEATVKKHASYFLLTSNWQQVPATKSNFIKVFPKAKQQIETYLQNNKINFSKEQDLVKLFGIATAEM